MAVDKQVIMEKLFAEKPLTNEEILHIGSKLGEETPAPAKGRKKKLVGYDHSIDKLSRACGLTDSDFESVNKLIRSEVMDKDKQLSADSMVVEVYEKIGLAKPVNFRVLMYQFVKMKKALQKQGNVGIRIDRGGGGLDDFLDFLKGRGL